MVRGTHPTRLPKPRRLRSLGAIRTSEEVQWQMVRGTHPTRLPKPRRLRSLRGLSLTYANCGKFRDS
jgi:hypothetical protein